jgi:predicted phage baseplate assembly protein
VSLLLTRPLGVKAAINPVIASGGADPEDRAAARSNAPLTVLTLDRVVSLRDYEDFARAYAGIGKALATWSWDGQRRGVFVTVAGSGGADVGGDVLERLLGAIRASGDPHVSVRVASYRPRAFSISFKVKVDPLLETSIVKGAAVDRLRSAFGFEARAFGQPVSLSEVLATLHGTRGIVAVDVDSLARTDGVGGSGLVAPLPAARPQADSLTGTHPAELLTLAEGPLQPGDMP